MKIGLKFTIYFFLISFLSMLVVGIISYQRAKSSLQDESFNRLTAVREMKAGQIEDYFQFISDQVSTFAEDRMIVRATNKLKESFNSIEQELNYAPQQKHMADSSLNAYFTYEYLPRLNKNLTVKTDIEKESSKDIRTRLLQNLYMSGNPNPVGQKHYQDAAYDSSSYTKFHKTFHPIVRKYLEKFGYYDIFIVDIETGNIVYSVFKEADYGTSLLTGPFKNTNLADAFREVRNSDSKDFVKLVDFKPYRPSYNAPASFIAAPIYENNVKIGALIFQLPIDRINKIMTSNQQWSKVGLGKTGETYIVGEDFTLRNQSRFLIEDSKNYFKMISDIGTPKHIVDEIKNFNSAIGLQEVRTEGTKSAVSGETDAKIFDDYRGVSFYRPTGH